MKKINILQNPYLLFFPFLIIYIIYIFNSPTEGNYGDEIGYLMYAENLLNGYCVTTFPDISLVSGPGYPIILMPFVHFNLPLNSITFLNAIFYYFSIIFLYKAFILIVEKWIAVSLSLLWALYYNSLFYISVIFTEIFTLFLINFLIFALIKAFSPNNKKNAKHFLILSGITIGYIVLTKIIFGYVLLFMLLGSIILWFSNRKSSNYKKGLIILLISFSINLPYLSHTYNLTGKFFYWGSSTGDNLYWMSTPFEGEYGDWHSFETLSDLNNSIFLNHREDGEKISLLNGIPDNEILKNIAINNIKSYPLKYIENFICNIGRLLFDYPYSNKQQVPSTLILIVQNGIISVFLLFSLIPTFLYWTKMIYPIRFLIFFSMLYLGGSALATAEARMFMIIIPILLVWIAYVLQNTIKINLKFKEYSNPIDIKGNPNDKMIQSLCASTLVDRKIE